MENLILFCGNNAQSDERVMNILEIVVAGGLFDYIKKSSGL